MCQWGPNYNKALPATHRRRSRRREAESAPVDLCISLLRRRLVERFFELPGDGLGEPTFSVPERHASILGSTNT